MTLFPGDSLRHSDAEQAGLLKSWGKRDTGPLNTYVPGPISSEPLVNSYHAEVRLIISGLLFLAIIVFVLVKGQAGGIGSAVALVGLWSLYGVPVWLRGRVGLRVDGSRAEVHGLFRSVAFQGSDVATVKREFAGRSPDVRLGLRDGRKVYVVTSRLEKGHSTLFEWLRRYAPDATYDPKAIDLRDMLVTRGLMGAPGDSWDGPAAPRVPEEQDNGAHTHRVPEEQSNGAALRLEGPGTTPTPEPSDEMTPAPQAQTHPESEAR